VNIDRFVCGVIVIACSTDLFSAEPELVGNALAPGEPLSLWYRQPAEKWVEALAIGNGRIGAMVFGGVNHERLQLNEGTLWAGGPYDPVNPQAREALPEARRRVFEGKEREAAKLISAKIMSKPLGQMPYQTAGDLILTFPESSTAENYRRYLNLDTAVATVEYTAHGIRFSRQAFASPVDQAIVVHLTADQSDVISELDLTRFQEVAGGRLAANTVTSCRRLIHMPRVARRKSCSGKPISTGNSSGSFANIPT